MIRNVAAFVFLVCFLSVSAWADVTVKGVNYSSPLGANDLPDMTVKKDSSDYTVYYKNNQFRMDSADGLSMIIRESGAGMEYVMMNHAKKEYLSMFSGIASIAESMTAAQASGLASGGAIDDSLNPEPRLGQEVKAARFWFKGVIMPPNQALAQSMGSGGNVPPQYANMLTIKMDIDGMAVVAPNMQGADEVQAFYDNMQQKMGAGEAALGISGGMNPYLTRGLTMVMAKLVGFGIPLLTMQTTTIKFETQGLPPQVAGMMQSMMSKMPGMGGGDKPDVAITEVSGVTLDPVDPAMFYGGAYPPGYKKMEPKKQKK